MTHKLNGRYVDALSIAYVHFLSYSMLMGIFFVFLDNKTAIFLDRQKEEKIFPIVMLELINTED